MGRRLGGPSTLMAMGHAGERWGGGNGGVWGGRLVVLDAQSPPGGLSHLSRPPCHGCLALSLSALVTTMVLGKHAQMAGRLGAVTCRALAGRSEQCMDHCHQRGGVHHGLERLADAPVPPGTLLVTTRCRTVQPIGPLASVLGLVLARSLRGKMRRVPSPYARIEDRLREALQPCGRQGCHGTQRDEASGKRCTKRCEKLRAFLRIPCLHQAQEDAHLGTDCGHRPQPTRGRAKGSGGTEELP